MKYKVDILGIALTLFLLYMSVMIGILVFRTDDTNTVRLLESDENVLLDAMRDLRQSMDKLNEELRDFENIKEETFGKDSESDTDIQE